MRGACNNDKSSATAGDDSERTLGPRMIKLPYNQAAANARDVRAAARRFTACTPADWLLEAGAEAAKRATAGSAVLFSRFRSSFDELREDQNLRRIALS